MNISGKLIEINDVQQISDTFRKRTFILEYTENQQYPEFISFDLIQDKCDLINTFQIGQIVTINFNLKGRKWVNAEGVTRYFNSLQAWRIDEVTPTASTSPFTQNNQKNVYPQTTESTTALELDDLPF